MQRLFYFFYQSRAFLLFALLEAISVWLITKSNNYINSSFFNTSNYYVGMILEARNNINEYFWLTRSNQQLADENANLRKQLTIALQKKILTPPNQSFYLKAHQYNFIAAQVINVSANKSVVTLNKGAEDGVKIDMGVISPQGVVGKIRTVSGHFSTAITLLHERMLISSKVKNKEIYGSTKWDGVDPRIANLLYVPRHHSVNKGDTIVTTQYNGIFPEGVVIGIVKNVALKTGKAEYNIEIELATDFSAMSYVYVVENKLKQEIDSLHTVSAEH